MQENAAKMYTSGGFRVNGGFLEAEPVLLNVYGAPELIPRNEFRQPM
jgi:hypothetical protein